MPKPCSWSLTRSRLYPSGLIHTSRGSWYFSGPSKWVRTPFQSPRSMHSSTAAFFSSLSKWSVMLPDILQTVRKAVNTWNGHESCLIPVRPYRTAILWVSQHCAYMAVWARSKNWSFSENIPVCTWSHLWCYQEDRWLQGFFLDAFLTNQLNWSWRFLSFSEILLEFFSKFSLSFSQFSLIFTNFCFISTESCK